jgi:hypothetical protein
MMAQGGGDRSPWTYTYTLSVAPNLARLATPLVLSCAGVTLQRRHPGPLAALVASIVG